MTELTYHDRHYHHGEESHRSRDESAGSGGQGGLLRKTHDAWDKVLYGIGTAYFKLCGR
jgi:hypothetical protein